jgi:hypothetical protein
MPKALQVFREQQDGIRKLIAAADLFTLIGVMDHRGEQPSPQLVKGLLETTSMTGFAVLGAAYSADDLVWIERNGSVQKLGQQIIVSVFTAVEWYLANKFGEYYQHVLQSKNDALVERTLTHLQKTVARSLEDARRMYRVFLGIDIRHFDLDYASTTDGCSFIPEDGWHALNLISDARNEIVHTGHSSSYAIRSLTDAYYPFQFARDWVELFDANFDTLLYEGWKTNLIQKYEERRDLAKRG